VLSAFAICAFTSHPSQPKVSHVGLAIFGFNIAPLSGYIWFQYSPPGWLYSPPGWLYLVPYSPHGWLYLVSI